MTRGEAIEKLKEKRDLYQEGTKLYQALDMAIYDMGQISELKKQRDAALDTAYASLKIAQERKKDGRPYQQTGGD